ncbi:uncharacterized protein [Aegilops tauschii subsp. strangulata]|uniref:uncharacterized protein n=1 Tax=Aegilops tauschii subsp. strangulata TaxID=200361 RepID=UPI003CC8BE31
MSREPWVMCGDFNEALWQHEHLSRSARAEAQMAASRDCLQICELEDLGFSGIPYTYDDGQAGFRNVQVRLDRACVDEALRDIYPAARVVHLATSCSDHIPLLINLEGVQEPRRRMSIPRYEIMWERDLKLPTAISEAWAKHRPVDNLGSVANSLKEVMTDLRHWSKLNFGNVLKEIENLRQQLADLQLSGADRTQIRAKMNQLDKLLYREEMLWLQRSRIAWLKEGERNTKYLHRRAVWRARRNQIQRPMTADGSWCNVPSDMERMSNSYFKEIFTKDPTLDPHEVLDSIVPKVSAEMNDSLCMPYSEEEI